MLDRKSNLTKMFQKYHLFFTIEKLKLPFVLFLLINK
jgi:hypothetical protein